MAVVVEPRQSKPAPGESWLGGGYTLGTSPATWPEVLRDVEKPLDLPPDRPAVSLLSAISAVALSAFGAAGGERLSSVLESVVRWLPKPALTQGAQAGATLLPDVEYMVCPDVPPSRSVRLEGYIRTVQRGREDFTLTVDDLADLLAEEGDA